jgi:thiamine pyrophosphate-dependent acetolactate synthase large subunit-like protein
MFNMKPNSLIYGARYDRVMEAFGGKGFFVEDAKHIRGALDEAMNPSRSGVRQHRAQPRDDLRAFPADARRQAGYQLDRVQRGLDPR